MGRDAVNRHNWVIDWDLRAIECEATSEPTDHDCAGCGARLSLDYLWMTFPGTELCMAADLVLDQADARKTA
jgi:hypothetical protein